jgi:hypothetical protein
MHSLEGTIQMKRICRCAALLPEVLQEGLLVFVFIVLPAVLAGCSSIYGVTYDYDRNINFALLETYNWVPIKMKAGADTMNIKRIQSAVNKNLQSKGYGQSSTSPDFIIVAVFGNQQRLAEAPDPYVAAYSPYTAPPVRYYEEGNLVLDFVDPDDKHLLWRGSASADLSEIKTPEQIEKTINAAVEKILKNYPPQ